MHLKMILSTTLLVLIVVGFITYGYTTYVVNQSQSIAAGADVLQKHGLLIYGQLAIQLLQFAVAGLIVYKG